MSPLNLTADDLCQPYTPGMTVMEQLIEALGEKPSTVVRRGWSLRQRDLHKVLEARATDAGPSVRSGKGPDEVWPLLSHHRFNPGTLFGLGESGQVHHKALSLLLAYDGLVASDPLHEVEVSARAGRNEQALADLRRVVSQIAEVEPLIDSGLIQFVSSRPSFTSASRKSVLDALGLGDLVVFRNFEEAFTDVVRFRVLAESDYADQLGYLYERLNLERPQISTAEETRRANAALASAVIYVSWQLAVCSEDTACDLTLTTNLEHRVLDEVMNRAAPGFDPSQFRHQRGKTRHVRRLAAGKLPNLDTRNLTSGDALALRRDDAFESFRNKLKQAMDVLPKDRSSPQEAGDAYSMFTERMQEAARELRESGKHTKLRNLMKPTSTDVGLGMTYSWLLSGGSDPEPSMFVEPLTKFSMTMYNWFQGRRDVNGKQVAMRYFASLGGQSA